MIDPDHMTYTPEEYRTARECAARWNRSGCPSDRKAIEWTLDMGGVSALVEIRKDMFGVMKMMPQMNPNRSRCADHHMRLPMLETILTPEMVEIAGYGIRPWADAPTTEEAHVKAMNMREAY